MERVTPVPEATTAPAAPTAATDQRVYDVVVVSETHWDRDWYMTFQQYRRRLVYVFDRLLDLLETKPSFKSFTFDGQACVIEDYLRIRPESEGRLRRLASEGRLLFGPWFTLPDEWLVSGEAMIRNLLTGRRVASAFGPVNTVGYCPDAFGHVNQLPQILAGFGLRSALFTRGFGDEMARLGLTFRWQSADPAISVLAVHQLGGYGNGSGLGHRNRHVDFTTDTRSDEEAIAYMRHALERMGEYTRTNTLLLNNGVDHMEAQQDLPEVIEAINRAGLGCRLRHGTYQDFVDAVEAEGVAMESWQGEFHLGREHVILPGTLSTRRYLKVLNARTQALLEGLAEPLAGLAQTLTGGEDLLAFQREAWRLTLLCHPHDDICGCSIDQVHREMVPRFQQAQQIGELLAHEGLRKLAAQCAAPRPAAVAQIAVFNPSTWERHGPAECRFVLLKEESDPGDAFRLVASDGRLVPAVFTPLGPRWTHTFTHFDPVVQAKEVHEWSVRFAAHELPPAGLEILSVERGDAGGVSGVVATDTTLENELVSVCVNANGTINLCDRATGAEQRGMLLFEDVCDVGDEYDFSAADDPGARTTAACEATSLVHDRGPHAASLRMTIPWELPARATEDRTGRVAELTGNTLTVTLTLRSKSPVVEATVSWDNRAKDHRLRAVFPSTIHTGHASAEAHFDVYDRPLVPPVPQVKWCQDPVNFHPMDRFVSISDGEMGLSILGEGLHEYEASPSDGGTRLEVTLLRSVGWLSRGDLKHGRPVGNAGPALEAAEAQCLGPAEARLGLVLHAGDWRRAGIPRRAQEFNVPLLATQVVRPAGARSTPWALVEASPADLHVTAIKRAERGDSVIVRAVNLGPARVTGRITAGFDVREAHVVDLAEDRQAALTVLRGRSVEVAVRSKQIVTVELVPAR